MIPRTIHYCWFGRGPRSAKADAAMRTWSQHLPGYDIVEWNEDNFELPSSPYIDRCVELKSWAFLSDYVRAAVLHQHGGIYLDVDLEIHRNLDRFLTHRCFTGFEAIGYPFTALWGSEAGHSFPKAVLDYFERPDAVAGIGTVTNTSWVSDILGNHFEIDRNCDTFQEGRDGVVVYPSATFCVRTGSSWASNKFEGSWSSAGGWGLDAHLLRVRQSKDFLELADPQSLLDLATAVRFTADQDSLRDTAAGTLLGERPSPEEAFRAARETMRRLRPAMSKATVALAPRDATEASRFARAAIRAGARTARQTARRLGGNR